MDVRSTKEHRAGTVGGALGIPLSKLRRGLRALTGKSYRLRNQTTKEPAASGDGGAAPVSDKPARRRPKPVPAVEG